ncbi:DUF1667 domain-containing protein [uncultured Acidaminococcus sp.]|uniref:DUF1667 domain-containing protein n=1 Tax=uncultured Acidaminococcus sp. TaxID=352152 RepID=UPI00265DC5DF|nr:DUF1667 domain-containing protein [uncultured Acidaminococcus sp.]
MNKEMTCIVCPNGCTLKLDYEIREGKPVLAKVTGNLCPQGLEYARQELLAPKRTIASSVLVEGGELPLVSVRTRGAIPKEKISDVMEEIRKCRVKAPVAAGTVLLSNVLGLGADVIATKTVEKK